MKTLSFTIHEKLSHLSQEQINELCRRYEAGESNKSLIKEFEIDTYNSGLQKLLPPKITSENCVYCTKPLWVHRSKPSSYSRDPFCPECGHKNSWTCKCDNCKEAECKEQEQRTQKVFGLLKSRFGPASAKRQLNSINNEELIYLSAFIRAADTESSFSDISFHHSSFKLSPNKYFDQEIINLLIDASLVCMVSIPEYYNETIESESDLDNMDLFICHYTLNVTDDRLDETEIWHSLYYPQCGKISEELLREVWKKIASHECLEFVICMVEDIGINYWYTDKHLQHLREIVKNFSVSQFYCMFFSSLKTATYNQTKNHWSGRETLHKSVVSTLKQSESAISNGWNVRKYNRNRNTTRSIISEVFFNLFLQIDQAGFYECPATFQFKNDNEEITKLDNQEENKEFRSIKNIVAGFDALPPFE